MQWTLRVLAPLSTGNNMDDKRIIYPNGEGGIAIVIPTPGSTEAEVMAAVPDGQPYLVVDSSLIPTDRTFRDAWEVDFTGAPIK